MGYYEITSDGYKTSDGKQFQSKSEAKAHGFSLESARERSIERSREREKIEKGNQIVRDFNAGNWDAIIKNRYIVHDPVAAGRNNILYILLATAYAKKGDYKNAFEELGYLWTFNVEEHYTDEKIRLGTQAIEDAKQAFANAHGRTMTKADLAEIVEAYIVEQLQQYEHGGFHNSGTAKLILKLINCWENITNRKLNKAEQKRIRGSAFPNDLEKIAGYDKYSEGHPILFGIIGAVVLGGIGFLLGKFIGLAIGGLAGWFIGNLKVSKISFGGGSSSSYSSEPRGVFLSIVFGLVGGIGFVWTLGWIFELFPVSNLPSWIFLIPFAVGAVLTFITWRNRSKFFFPLIILALFGYLYYFHIVPKPNSKPTTTQTQKAATITGQAIVIADEVIIRQKSSSKSNQITFAIKDQTMSVTGKAKGEWTPVSFMGKRGWVETEGIKILESNSATTSQNVNFRDKPSTDSNIIRQIPQGETITITGEAQNGWTPIQHGKDKGWISSEFVKQ